MDWLNQIGLGKDQTLILLEVMVAMVLGGIIGYDREAAHKPAGLRTHMLVASASALFVGLGSLIVQSFETRFPIDSVRTDPIRIFEAVITGISFLGAGTIIRHRGAEHVEGITTAASLLMTAAIGATVGLSQRAVAVLLTGVVFVVLHIVSRIKVRTMRNQKQQ